MLCKFIGRKEREDRLAQGGRMGGPTGSERGKRGMMPSRQGLLDLQHGARVEHAQVHHLTK